MGNGTRMAQQKQARRQTHLTKQRNAVDTAVHARSSTNDKCPENMNARGSEKVAVSCCDITALTFRQASMDMMYN
jgi:hypothetical protein